MIISINQPAYLPWLGYFDRIDLSDLHVMLDHVQFEKNSLINRNKLRTPTGWTWLTIPIVTKGRFEHLSIHDLEVADKGRWRRKHWKTIEANYARAPQFEALGDVIKRTLDENAESSDFLPIVDTLNRRCLEWLNIKTPIVSSSSMDLLEKKGDLVIEICKKVGATTYVSGPLGRNYLDLEDFKRAEIEVVFHDYAPPRYQQVWPGFESGMAALDALLCLQSADVAQIMRSGRRLSKAL